MTGLDALNFNSFDQFADMLQLEENKSKLAQQPVKTNPKEQPAKKQAITKQDTDKQTTTKKATTTVVNPVKNPTRYQRSKKGPMVISITEFNEKIKNGEIHIINMPKSLKPEERVKPKVEVKPKTIKKPKAKKAEAIKEPKKTFAEKRRIAKKAKIIEKNLAAQMRYTEPKKRNLLNRIALQGRLARGTYDYVEADLEDGSITEEDVIESKNATRWIDRRLYKKVQNYEDAVDDVTVRRGWLAFKVGLAATALAGSLALGNYMLNEIKDFGDKVNQPTEIVSIYDMDESERADLESYAYHLQIIIANNDGYHFDTLSRTEIADGYNRMVTYEKEKLSENSFKKALNNLGIAGDQNLLTQIVRESFGDEYNNFTDEQKKEYEQLAFELLPYSHPELFKEENDYIRNPIVMRELEARNNALSKGYQISLRVNNDEKETIKTLGKLIHYINGITQQDYINASLSQNGQQEFFDKALDRILIDGKESLERKERRDYEQIIYEWLPDMGKQYIKDPIEVERQAFIDAQSNDGLER